MYFYLLDWVAFYRQKWVIASLNKCMSKIDDNIWLTSPDNTNVAESAHALSNRYGKNLKLVTAILRYVNIFIFFNTKKIVCLFYINLL